MTQDGSEHNTRIEELINGYYRFRASRFEEARRIYRKLGRQGQSPKVMVVACCDSRVDPAMITDTGPGELFITRNVANLVPPCTPDNHHHGTSAALEFGVTHLNVQHIIVMGHANCGGAKALLAEIDNTSPSTDFIDAWMTIADDAGKRIRDEFADATPETQLLALEHEIVRVSLHNLMTFGWIRERVEESTLHLHGWYFGIEKGILYTLDPATGDFIPVPENQ